jgi:ATP-binding cassette subfamily B protein
MQRISLARALFFSNGILILDEICSSLDLESEKKIIKILKKLSRDYMILYITHRDNFFDEFDQVIKIN